MKPHFLFRFHKNPDVCLQNLHLLRKLNPDTPIHGMFGGSGGLESLPKELTSAMDTVWAVPLEDPYNNWKNADICIRWWFKQVGIAYPFSHLVIVEWDMPYFKSIEGLFGPLQPDANYMTISGTYQSLLNEKWPWIQGQWKWQVDALLKQLEQEGTPVDITQLSFAPMGGCVLCRTFLEKLSEYMVPSYSNDEVRIALYSRAFGIPLLDNGFKRDNAVIFEPAPEDGGKVFTLEDVRAHLAKGGKTLHPVRHIIPGLETMSS